MSDLAACQSKEDKAEHDAACFASLDRLCGIEAPINLEAPANPDEIELQEKQNAKIEEGPEFKKEFDALGYLKLARKHPNLTAQEREILAKGIIRYGTYVAKRTERVLITAGYVEDAANAFAKHAIRLMDEGKYEDRRTFRGWLSKVWRNYHWQYHTKQAAIQRSKEVGLQDWETEGSEDGRAEAGRVMADQVFANSKTSLQDALDDARDFRNQTLTAKLDQFQPLLTPEQHRILQQQLSGRTNEEIAERELISVSTLRQRRKEIETKYTKQDSESAALAASRKMEAIERLSVMRLERQQAIDEREAFNKAWERKMNVSAVPKEQRPVAVEGHKLFLADQDWESDLIWKMLSEIESAGVHRRTAFRVPLLVSIGEEVLADE